MATENQAVISPTCNVPSKFIEIKGSKLHYLESGSGEPMLFLHGMPTWSYVWRNIIPQVDEVARCIAPDLIGMGLSDKPDIDYRIFDHIDYIEAFVEQLDLRDITLVLHGWGSVVGFEIARRHPDRIKAIAFYESHVRAVTNWDMLALPVQQFAALLQRPGASYRAIVKQNYLIRKLLPSGVIRSLSDAEKAAYEEPFNTEESRKPLWQYVQDLPLGDGPADVVELINGYSNWLKQTDIPKLMMYAVPGFITTMDTVTWARDNFKNLSLVSLDDALHFAQETAPEQFSMTLKEWYLGL